jgi:membrane protease YdiL (CAAX protease family)
MRPQPSRPDLNPAFPVPPPYSARDVTQRPWPMATWSLLETVMVFLVPFGIVLYLDVILGAFGIHNSPGTSLFLTSVQEFLFIVPVLWWMRETGNGGIEKMGLRSGQFSAGDVGTGIGIGVGLIFLSAIILSITRSIVDSVFGRMHSVTGLERVFPGHWLYPGAVIAVVLAPIGEEFLFRGFLFQGLRRRWSFWPAALTSGLMFALLHGQAIRIPELTVAGVILASVFERRRTLVAPIAAHVTLNIVAVVLTFTLR